MRNRVLRPVVFGGSDGFFAGDVGLNFPLLVVALCLIAAPIAQGQEAETAVAAHVPTAVQAGVAKSAPEKEPAAQEITAEGMISYGDYRIFGATARCNVWTAGLEYDRHMFGYHFKAQLDYVVEVLPVVLLSQPADANYWGGSLTPNQELVPGLGLSPIGFRFLWRSGRKIKPYMIAKGGAIAFTKKAMSPNASYANFNWQGETGVEVRLTDRVELRLGPIEHFHVSNGRFHGGSNPGMDELSAKIGVSYHIGRRVVR